MINFKKLKSQIRQEIVDGKKVWHFEPTKEQASDDRVGSYYYGGGKNKFARILVFMYPDEFKF